MAVILLLTSIIKFNYQFKLGGVTHCFAEKYIIEYY